YPVGLAVTRTHVFARWEGAGICFNIEASNPAGMTVHPDEHFRRLRGGMTAQEEKSGFYVRTLFPVEEFAVFMKARIACLIDAARYDETMLWAARALQFAPNDPHFPAHAHYALDLALRHRMWHVNPSYKIPPPSQPFDIDAGNLLRVEERAHFQTIV